MGVIFCCSLTLILMCRRTFCNSASLELDGLEEGCQQYFFVGEGDHWELPDLWLQLLGKAALGDSWQGEQR